MLYEAAEPFDALLLQEVGKPRGGFRDVLSILQLLLADSEAGQERNAPADRCDDGRDYRSSLEF